jgi:hypothetical protein
VSVAKVPWQELSGRWAVQSLELTRETKMADNGGGGGVGVLGVLVGALIVVLVGGGIMFATGLIGSKSITTTLKVVMPKITSPAPS